MLMRLKDFAARQGVSLYTMLDFVADGMPVIRRRNRRIWVYAEQAEGWLKELGEASATSPAQIAWPVQSPPERGRRSCPSSRGRMNAPAGEPQTPHGREFVRALTLKRRVDHGEPQTAHGREFLRRLTWPEGVPYPKPKRKKKAKRAKG